MALMAGLTGCTPPPLPPIDPVTELGERSCALHPEAGATTDLALTPESRRTAVIGIDRQAPCLRFDGGAPGLYHAFNLPVMDSPMLALISSLPAGHALFAPRVLLVSGANGSIRETGIDSFHFRGGVLSTLVRLHKDDRQLIVASAPDVVGHPIERIQEQVEHYFIPYPYIPINVGSERDTVVVYSYTGRIVVGLAPLPNDSLDP